jgi:chloramphenicol O-acetyltransferase type A
MRDESNPFRLQTSDSRLQTIMREIEIEKWKRRETFEFFRNFENPFFNLTAPVEATNLYRFCKKNNLSFSLASLFYSIKTANEISEFRLRLIGEKLVEFDKIHVTQTILNDDETFSFCYFELKDDVFEFNEAGKKAVEKYKKLKTFDVEADRLDLIYYSVIPWVSFTSFKNATRLDYSATVPRIAFGKLFEENGKMKLPHSVEVHHSIMDGIHVGKYFNGLQEKLDNLTSEF